MRRCDRHQKGFALVTVMIIMLVGSIVITALLKMSGTGIITTSHYEDKSQELYAADAGIEDGRWLVEKGKLNTTFPGPNPPAYTPFDYYDLAGHEWTYGLQPQTGRTVNGYSVNVTVRNMWIPDLAVPSAADAAAIIRGTVGNPPKVVLTGTVVDLPNAGTPGRYRVKIAYSGSDPLNIRSLGVWLPPGFTYQSTSTDMTNDLRPGGPGPMYDDVASESYKSGEKTVWTFTNYPFSGDTTHDPFPGFSIDDAPDYVAYAEFYFSGSDGSAPAAVSWLDTDLDLGGGVSYTWDGDKKVYQLLSTAGSTSVEAYTIKTELREMASAIQGDYYATGNSLMTNSHSDSYHIRDAWTNTEHSSSNSVPQESAPGAGNGVPRDGEVQAAYLYWTSWFHESNKVSVAPLNPDTCTNFNNWTRSGSSPYLNTSWGGDGDVFTGHVRSSTGAPYARLTLKDGAVNLSPYSQGLVTVSWDQGVSLVSAGFADGCANFNNWTRTSPNVWALSGTSNYFTGHYDVSHTNRLLSLGHNELLGGAVPGQVTISWKQWQTLTSTPVTAFSDDCSNFTHWTQSGTIWSIGNSMGNYYFRGQAATGTTGSRDIVHAENLSSYSSSGTVTLSWDQWVSSGAGSGDGISVDFSSDNGVTWTTQATYTGSFSGTQNKSIPIPSAYLTSGFRMRYHLIGFASSVVSFKIDSVNIQYVASASAPGVNDGLDVAYSSDGGTTWSANTAVFRGGLVTTRPSSNNEEVSVPDAYLTDQFRVRFELVGFGSTGQYLNLDDITLTTPAPPPIGPNDGLDFAFSGDNGANWSANVVAFRENASPSRFSYAVPSAYLTSGFKIRFELVGFSGSGQYCTIDNIKLTAGLPDSSAFLKINGTQVYFDASGNPAAGSQNITADRAAVINNVIGTNPTGFSYACFKDVTALVRAYSPSPTNPATNRPGIATYTVGGVDGTVGNDSLPGDGYQLAHAGWSLIIVYSSPETLGHQLYLFDRFSFCDDYADIDFDGDHVPGGTVTGFIVPDRVGTEPNAAKMTVMVGEGDDFIAGSNRSGAGSANGYYPGDFVAFNAPDQYRASPNIPARDIPNSYKLWDGKQSVVVSGSNTQASPNNIWNGLSTAFNADGVDVDTLFVPWSSGLIAAGDTSANIDICTAQDNWNLIYVILSFRSKATTGGSVTYIIH
jgi:hypothetical protein